MSGDAAMSAVAPSRPWWATLTPYAWFVVAIAGLAWLCDTLDQRLFSLARISALSDLMGLPGSDARVQAEAKVATACFLIGWGLGGLTLGALGDRYGRARLLAISVLIYSIGTGLTGFCQDVTEFSALRLFTGLGIGGVFGLAVALIAESVPEQARLPALGLLQVLSTVGNVGAAFIKLAIDDFAEAQGIGIAHDWRLVFWVGAAPALLTVPCMLFLKESPAWLALRDAGTLPKNGIIGPYRALLANGQQRRGLLVGSLLAIAGVVGLWGIGEYSVDLQDAVFTRHYMAQGLTDFAPLVAAAKNYAYISQMAGAAVGMMLFGWAAARLGRRPAFIGAFSVALATTVFAFWSMNSPADAYWMAALMGAGQFSVFAGFAIYLPELFSAASRSTGVSFAYNIGRFAAAGGSFFSASLTTSVFRDLPAPMPLRYAAIVMSAVFVIGLVAALLAPETRGKALRE